MTETINYIDVSNFSSKKLKKYDREEIESMDLVMTNFTTNASITSAVLSAGNKFPNDLSPEKCISIHVYNTSKQDKVVSGMIDSTADIASKVIDTFTSIKRENDKDAKTIAEESLENVWNTLKGAFDLALESPVNVNDVTKHFKNIDIKKDTSYYFGNQKLAKVYYETFFLPIPNSLQEQISNNYEERPGWINDLGGGRIKNTINSAVDYTAPHANLSTIAKHTGARNIRYYENKLQMYNSTDFREITLTWNLVPNNEKESRLLHEMVRKIKMYGSPETSNGNLIVTAPCFFGIEFKNKTLDKALQFYEVVLTNVSIDYVPGGNMEMNEDESPKYISLSMTFKDREPKLRQSWETSNPNTMTGSNDQSCPT